MLDFLGLSCLQQYFSYKFGLGSVSANNVLHLLENEDPAIINKATLPSFVTKNFDGSQITPPTICVPKPNNFSNFMDYFLQKCKFYLFYFIFPL